MWVLRLLSIGTVILCLFSYAKSDKSDERKLEKELLKGYNNKIRPVKLETTVTQVTVFLNIAHVEKVDEHEQTALVHGHLWASWTDEYLQWDKNKSNITKLQIQPFRIWQPALALYNSARGNAWHLYMNGLPATVYYSGKVWSSGTFSFFVTCQFDFTDWPFDKQNCPIVIADWVYGLAQVNLSDPNNVAEYAKPSIRLSYDPVEKKNKRHVGGWEVEDAWKKHCYWGPKGCKTDQPEGETDWYWSLLEFGVILKRHLPYFGLSILIPLFMTSFITLAVFWVDTFSVNISVIIFNILLQGVYGWNMIQNMPPGSGRTPKIVQLYTMNIFLSGIQLLLVVVSKFLEDNLPKNYEIKFGFDITEIPKKMGVDRFFKPKGISFDPQELLNPIEPPEFLESILEQGNSASIGIGNALGMDDDPRFSSFQNPNAEESSGDTALLINLPTNDEHSEVALGDPEAPENSEAVDTPESDAEVGKKEKKDKKKKKQRRRRIIIYREPDTKLQSQLHHIKRYTFCLTVVIYIVAFLMCLYL